MIATGINRVQRDRPAGAGTAGTDAVAAMFAFFLSYGDASAYPAVGP
jgi:hypothetical protein